MFYNTKFLKIWKEAKYELFYKLGKQTRESEKIGNSWPHEFNQIFGNGLRLKAPFLILTSPTSAGFFEPETGASKNRPPFPLIAFPMAKYYVRSLAYFYFAKFLG